MARPLDGIRILDFSTMILGPLATQYLGDMGADVVKIEPPDGDLTRAIGPRRSTGMAAFYLNSNRNKRSLVLDLKAEGAQEVLHRLVRQCDVVVHSVRTSATRRIGLAYDQLSAINPGLVYCHVKGFSDRGPYAGKPAYDDVAQAESGLAMMQVPVTGEPRYVPSILADKITAVHAAMAILAAVHHRTRTGEGQEVHVPMFETMAAFNTVEHLWGEVFQPPLGGMGYAPIVAGTRRPFRTRDGHYLCVLPYTDGHWRRFCHEVDQPDLATDPRFATHAARVSDQETFWDQVGRMVARFDKADLLERLKRADMPYGEVNSFHDLLRNPQLESLGFWQSVDHPTEGNLRTARLPIEMSGTPLETYTHAPGLGEHTDIILDELGIPADEQARLKRSGVFGKTCKSD